MKKITTKSSNKQNIAVSALIVVVILTAFYIVGIGEPSTQTLTNLTSEPASLTIVTPTGKTVDVGEFNQINWLSTNYIPKAVNINLIRKVSDNPNRYEVVRSIASPTTNDGQAAWIPKVSDQGQTLSVEIGCNVSANSCTSGANLSEPLAVVNTGRFSNLASTYDAIVQLMNK